MSSVLYFKIASKKAHNTRVNFYREKDDIWLSNTIPAKFIT